MNNPIRKSRVRYCAISNPVELAEIVKLCKEIGLESQIVVGRDAIITGVIIPRETYTGISVDLHSYSYTLCIDWEPAYHKRASSLELILLLERRKENHEKTSNRTRDICNKTH